MKRSKIVSLPKDIHAELDRKLLDGEFTDYRGLAEWLAEKGYQISYGSVHRYGKNFEKRLAALSVVMKQAEAVVKANPDDEGVMNDAVLKLTQKRVFEILLETEMSQGEMAKIAHAVADLGKAAVMQNAWANKVRVRLEKQKQGASERIAEMGLSTSTAEAIRNILLGIDPLNRLSEADVSR